MAEAEKAAGRVASVMQEHRTFPPPEAFSSKARIGSLEAYHEIYDRAAADPAAFWAERADALPWLKPYDEVLRWNAPHAEWFAGGQTNASAACIDQHVAAGLGDKTALVWVGEPTGERRTLTFRELQAEVSKVAAGLAKLGIKQGDVVSIYMPMTPELVIAMLACARIGAVHSVIFGGFSSEAIADRNNDAAAVAVITADGGWRRGSALPLKANVDEALEKSPTVKHVIVLKRTGQDVTMVAGRDIWWHDLGADMPEDDPKRYAEALDAVREARKKAGDSTFPPGSGTDNTEQQASAFSVGDRVRAKTVHPVGHTRLPRYVRGRVGEVIRCYRPQGFQDHEPLRDQTGPQPMYAVRFEGAELWGEQSESNSSVVLDMWESYLERA